MLTRLLKTYLHDYRKLLLLVVVLQAVQTMATLTLPTLNANITVTLGSNSVGHCHVSIETKNATRP